MRMGYLKCENGIMACMVSHSLMRTTGRHTPSFASLYAYPNLRENIDVEIRDEDLKVDILSLQGPGGQHE